MCERTTSVLNATDGGPRVMEGAGAAMRMTGVAVLREKAQRMRQQADQLDALADALPVKLPAAADEALWNLAIQIGTRS